MTCTVCSGPMPAHTALSTCSWPCALVARHIFTLDQIRAAVGASTGGTHA